MSTIHSMKIEEIQMDKYIVNKECSFSASDEYVIVFNKAKENVFMLDKTGKEVWQLFQTESTVEAAAKALMKIYSAEYEVIYKDILNLLESLVQEGLCYKV